ncbi:MAG: T9SS type A sorting domain-containing protein [Bacteroidetes bacterium]|nr:T9SS type A sorting domain-containing protein [Bacteroidota bacterium]
MAHLHHPFQNTGNAPAQHIVITDTLDSKLQEATFTYLGSSHDPFTQIVGNVVKFNFPNINLPDSTNDEPNSHGYVQYKVKIDQGLLLGQIIENNAAIYFDFNAPVITNTTLTTIVIPTDVIEIAEDLFSVYPNPSYEKLTIRSTSSGLHHLILTDVAGRIVYKKEFSGNEFNFNVSEFASGMYFLNLESEEKSEVLKVVVR